MSKMDTIKSMFHYNLKNTTPPLYRIASIELTNRCNYRCAFCPYQNQEIMKRNFSDMSLEDFRYIIHEYKQYLSVPNLVWHGESLLHPQFDDFVRILKEEKIDYCLTTNGSMLHEHVNIFKIHPPKSLMLSLYTTNQQKYKKFTRYGNLDNVITNIINFIKVNPSTYVDIRVIKMHGYEEDVKDIENLFKNKNVNISYNTLHSQGGRVDVSKFDNPNNHTIDFKYCIQPWKYCFIGSDMGIYICDCHDDTPIGNLKEQTLEEIWNSSKYQEIRKNILTGQFRKNEMCRYCDSFEIYGLANKPTIFFPFTKIFIYKILINYFPKRFNAQNLLKRVKRKEKTWVQQERERREFIKEKTGVDVK